jgi:hypothetical protein
MVGYLPSRAHETMDSKIPKMKHIILAQVKNILRAKVIATVTANEGNERNFTTVARLCSASAMLPWMTERIHRVNNW